ncbi:MAG TPA: efflux RND transporter periplasmic adaptor subunit, partial [Burkholderiaceae bacterium]|nr:efflux RND transporter periplasmic adaptor subunit [Burkholderiaceae bacterium]
MSPPAPPSPPRGRRPHATARRGAPAIAALAALVLAACSGEPPPPPPDAGPAISGTTVRFPRRVEGIRTDAVQDAGTTTLTLPGRLAWDEDRTVRVFPPFAGRVTALRVQVGDAVRAGQPLAEIAAPEFGQAVADARRAEADEALA